MYHEERLDETERLVMVLPLDDPKADLLAADHELQWQGRRFYVAEVEDTRDGSRPTRTVEAFALWYRLNDPTHVGSLVIDRATIREGLAEILAGSGWTIGAATSSSATLYSLEQQDRTVLAMLRAWAKVTGTFVVWDTDSRAVNLTTTRGANRGMQFRYRRNLRRVRRRHRPPEATVLYPYGANGLTVAGVNGGLQYLEDFSYYTAQGLTLPEARARFTRSRVWSDSSFLVDAELLAAAETRLAELAAGATTYELSIVDLSELSGATELAELADTVRVVDEDLGADLTTTVVRRRRYPLQPWRDEIELGTVSDLFRSDEPAARDLSAEEWQLFADDLAAALEVRNDGRYIAGRIPLRFREGGQAHWHLDVFATGVGDGALLVDVYDELTATTIRGPLRLAYTDGEQVHGSLQFAETSRSGAYDYRARVTTEADGGPSSAAGVDLAVGDLRFFVLARGAVQETPTADDSATFEFTGAIQQFTVPDSVTEITITAAAAAGALSELYPGTRARGAIVSATFAVTPGAVLDVYVGGCPADGERIGGWPDGGYGDITTGSGGTGGGGSSRVIPQGGALASAYIVAGAGGGQGEGFATATQSGGAGGLFAGADAVLGAPEGGNCPGAGATQFAGGAGGTGTDDNGMPGAFGQGGDAGDMISSFGFAPGGGGGGWYGGGGGGANLGSGAGTGGGGGGGSGYVAPGAWNIEADDGGNTGTDGQVVISWTNPE